MQTLKTRSIAGIASLAATAATIAFAAPVRAETVSIPVSYADLDLSTPEGARTLDRRVARAADKICGQSVTGDRFRPARCRAEVLNSAAVRIAEVRTKTAPVALAAR